MSKWQFVAAILVVSWSGWEWQGTAGKYQGTVSEQQGTVGKQQGTAG